MTVTAALSARAATTWKSSSAATSATGHVTELTAGRNREEGGEMALPVPGSNTSDIALAEVVCHPNSDAKQRCF